jgi:16S rRNA (cytidine1402-2'-O)-methyltransferase
VPKPKEEPSASKCFKKGELLTDRIQSLESALYFVATPIGAAKDITLRSLDILAGADVLAAEDTRNTRRLLDIHGVDLAGRHLIPYHDHNGPAQRPKLIAALKAGKSVAYVSDAGTPLIADPGYSLARAVIDEGLKVLAAPGASAVLAALAVAGLPTDRFFFAGFLPPKTGARLKELSGLAAVPGTLVFYESPKRISKSLIDMVQGLGGDRQAAVCRELTKKFEEVRRGTLDELAKIYEDEKPRGEIVVVVGPAPTREVDPDAVGNALKLALSEQSSLRDAVDQVTVLLRLPRKQVYQLALEMERNK